MREYDILPMSWLHAQNKGRIKDSINDSLALPIKFYQQADWQLCSIRDWLSINPPIGKAKFCQ